MNPCHILCWIVADNRNRGGIGRYRSRPRRCHIFFFCDGQGPSCHSPFVSQEPKSIKRTSGVGLGHRAHITIEQCVSVLQSSRHGTRHTCFHHRRKISIGRRVGEKSLLPQDQPLDRSHSGPL